MKLGSFTYPVLTSDPTLVASLSDKERIKRIAPQFHCWVEMEINGKFEKFDVTFAYGMLVLLKPSYSYERNGVYNTGELADYNHEYKCIIENLKMLGPNFL